MFIKEAIDSPSEPLDAILTIAIACTALELIVGFFLFWRKSLQHQATIPFLPPSHLARFLSKPSGSPPLRARSETIFPPQCARSTSSCTPAVTAARSWSTAPTTGPWATARMAATPLVPSTSWTGLATVASALDLAETRTSASLWYVPLCTTRVGTLNARTSRF